METNQDLTRPKTFQLGGVYLYLDESLTSGSLNQVQKMTPIDFVAYDVCPAYIIVKNGSGKRWRCPRDQIFELNALV